MANKQIVFVHGEDKGQARTPFMFYHLHPSTYTTPVKTEGGKFDLVYFDYQLGKRTTWKSWTPMRSKERPSATPDEEVDITPKVKIRDDLGGEVDGIERGSITGLYSWVKAQAKESVASIQIFSHAVIHGPVIFKRAFEYGDDHLKLLDIEELRDPTDSEPRLRDFEGDNPLADSATAVEGGIAKFREALTTDCFIKVWGCGEQTFTNNDGAAIRKLVVRFLSEKGISDAAEAARNILVLAYLDHVQTFWPFRLAERLGMPVWAGGVGWGSDEWESDGRPGDGSPIFKYKGTFPPDLKENEWWWRMSKHFRNNRKITQTFFKDRLKAQLDPMSFVEYKKSWVDDAIAAATASRSPRRSPIMPASITGFYERLESFNRFFSGAEP